MTNNKLNSKNWQKVRLNTKSKLITFTNDTIYKTKAECENNIKSNQYIAINLKALNKLLSDGYSVNDTTINPQQENALESLKQAENVNENKQEFNPEVEEAIRQNYIKKVEKKGVIMYKGASTPNEYNDDVKRFLNTPPTQTRHKPFDMRFYSLTTRQKNSILNGKKTLEDFL